MSQRIERAGGRTDISRRRQRNLVPVVELVTGAAALAGGVALAVSPDGSLLHADPSVLIGNPFADWRLPGMLLASLAGCGFAGIGLWEWRGGRYGRELSIPAGAGLVAFEGAELMWLGFQPLELVFAIVGVVAAVAWRGGIES